MQNQLNINLNPKAYSIKYGQKGLLQKSKGNYAIQLMSLIYTQIKSIKQLFDQIKSQIGMKHDIQIIKFINLYHVFKDFYKSFKHRQKDYIQKYFYGHKTIHQQCITMKKRLLAELSDQNQKRIQVQEKLQALQLIMQASLQSKDDEVQKLNQQIQSLLNNTSRRSSLHFHGQPNPLKTQLFFSTHQPNGKMLADIQSLENQKRQKISFLSVGVNSGSLQRSLEYPNQLNLHSGRLFEMKFDGKQVKSQEESLEEEEENKEQTNFKQNQDTNKLNSPNHHKMTLSLEAPKSLSLSIYPQKKQPLQQKENVVEKQLLNELEQLRLQLQKEKQEKQAFKQKIKQGDGQYKKLQSEINQLYKLISRPKSKTKIQEIEIPSSQNLKKPYYQQLDTNANKGPINSSQPNYQQLLSCQQFEGVVSKAQQVQSKPVQKIPQKINSDLSKRPEAKNSVASVPKKKLNSSDNDLKKQASLSKNSLQKANNVILINNAQKKPILQKKKSIQLQKGSTGNNQDLQKQITQKLEAQYKNILADKDQQIEKLKDKPIQYQAEQEQLIRMLLLQALSIEHFIIQTQSNEEMQGIKHNLQDEIYY